MRGFTFPLAILLAIVAHPCPTAAQSFDLLIRGGRVLDGTGNPAFVADVGVAGGEIVAVGDLAGASATREIDATGLHVTPGFIDMHSHADRSLFSGGIEIRRASNLVAQGITTVVFGPDGRSNRGPNHGKRSGKF
ncbi:MAG: amidohydrolase family protein, partial [Gammaproteobacteria bacterium]|nr:amidohydrolase family protein [Gammaproteobacteria bacterium]